MKSVLVVYSGGLDSFTLLNRALNKFERVEAITFDYGQKHRKEITFASEVCSQNSIPHEIVNLNLEKILSGSALVGSSEIPEGNYDKEKNETNNCAKQKYDNDFSSCFSSNQK